jgi:predicted nucleic-acid-binding protein
MKALDTNVLIRYLVADDPTQTRQAARIIEDAQRLGEQLFLSVLVLCEVVWVLERRYRQSRPAIAGVLDQVLDTAVFLVEHADLVRTCIGRFRDGKGTWRTTQLP